MMNEFFCLPIIQNMLQNVVDVFTMHTLPLVAQQTCYHCDKVYANVGWKFSNFHLILFNGLGHVNSHVIYESIP